MRSGLCKLTIQVPNSPCIIWRGARNAYGYGVRKVGGRKGKVIRIHREAYEAVHGPIPREKVIMHTCDNRACFNVKHLRTGTQRENIYDSIAKGRSPQLSAKKFDHARARDLRACGCKVKDIATWLGVAETNIYVALRE